MNTQDHTTPESDILFARGGTSDIFGPLDDEVVVRFNGDVKIDLLRRARQLGYSSVSEHIRMLAVKEMYGEEHVVSLVLKRAMGNTANVLRVPGGVAK